MALPRLDPEFSKPRLEVIEWVDSQSTFTGWTLLDEIAPDRPVVGLMLSAGWVIRENADAVLIAGCLGGVDGRTSPQVSAVMTIPKVAIRKRHRIPTRP